MSDEITAVLIVTAAMFGAATGFAIMIGQEMKLNLHLWRWRNIDIPDADITTFHQARAFLEYIGYGLESAGNSLWYVDAPGLSDIEQWASDRVIKEAVEKRAYLILARKRKQRKGR